MRIRVKSNHAPFRRAGLSFHQAGAWQEHQVDALGADRLLRLCLDPSLAVEAFEAGEDEDEAEGVWRRPPPGAIEQLRAYLAQSPIGHVVSDDGPGGDARDTAGLEGARDDPGPASLGTEAPAEAVTAPPPKARAARANSKSKAKAEP